MKKVLSFVIFAMFISMISAQVSKTINVVMPGTLSTLLTSTEKSTVTNLTLTGNIDARDVKYMRDEMTVLAVLDISAVLIKSYNGDGGTIRFSSNYYENTLPQSSFRNVDNNISKITLTSIILPVSLKSIDDYAFYNCTGLASITIPNTLTSIGYKAFDNTKWYNDKLDGVVYAGKVLYEYKGTMPDNTTINVLEGTVSIKDNAFNNRNGLASINIPNSVISIGACAFCDTKWYNDKPDGAVYAGKVLYRYKGTMPENTTINLLEGTVSISIGAFESCSGLTSIHIPNSVTSIGYAAFKHCKGLTSITIPSNSIIGREVLSGCINLKKIIGPADLVNILLEADGEDIEPGIISITLDTVILNSGSLNFDGISILQLSNKELKYLNLKDTQTKELTDEAFNNFFHLDSLHLPINLEKIKYKEFAECISLRNINIPASVTEIGMRAFENCRSLNSVNFELNSQLKTINNWAFYACHGLQNITIPNGVTTVGDGAFWGCEYLSDLTLPSTVQKINDNGFDGCIGLSRIKVNAAVPPVVSAKTFNRVNKNASIYVPDASVSMYKNAFGWKDFFNINGISTQTTELIEPTYSIRVVNKSIEITNANGLTVEIFDIAGRKLYTKTNAESQLNIQLQQSGVYLLKIGDFKKKLIID